MTRLDPELEHADHFNEVPRSGFVLGCVLGVVVLLGFCVALAWALGSV